MIPEFANEGHLTAVAQLLLEPAEITLHLHLDILGV